MIVVLQAVALALLALLYVELRRHDRGARDRDEKILNEAKRAAAILLVDAKLAAGGLLADAQLEALTVLKRAEQRADAARLAAEAAELKLRATIAHAAEHKGA